MTSRDEYEAGAADGHERLSEDHADRWRSAGHRSRRRIRQRRRIRSSS